MVIISDQGCEFVNQIQEELYRLTGTEHRVTSAYHPQTNGLTERFNQTLQTALLKVVKETQTDWDEHLQTLYSRLNILRLYCAINFIILLLLYYYTCIILVNCKCRMSIS